MPPRSDDTPETALARLGVTFGAWLPLTGGRSNQLWKVGSVVVKRFDLNAATPLFPNDPRAEARALSLLAPLSLAPPLRAEGRDWIIYDHIAGPTWSSDANPAALARMLHHLHGSSLPADSFRQTANGSAAILAHARTFAPSDLPPPPSDPHLPPVRPSPIHTDPVLGNILDTAVGPLLIDWQCPGMGDPAEDLATLTSPAMMWLYTGRKLSPDWAEAVLAAYPDATTVERTRALLPLYHWRIMAHCAWKAARGDADYAAALRIELNA